MFDRTLFLCPQKRLWLNGEYVEIIRRRRKIKLHVLASSINASYDSLHCWLEGQRRIPRTKLEALAKVLNVPVRSLVIEAPHV